jgi:hypothetical protein
MCGSRRHEPWKPFRKTLLPQCLHYVTFWHRHECAMICVQRVRTDRHGVDSQHSYEVL